LRSYVFDGKPPDMKKQELAKRHAIFFHPLIIPMLFRDFLKSVLQILILLLECTILFRYSKREDATKELTEAVEVTVLIKVLTFWHHILVSTSSENGP